MRRLFTSSLAFWSGFNILFLLLLGVAQYVIGERTSPTALLLYLPQHGFGVLTLVLVLASLRKSKRKLLALNLVAGLAFLFFFLGVQVPLGAAPQGQTVRVMTWNIEKFRGSVPQVAALIRAQNPDIVCMQETVRRHGQADDTPDLLAHFPGWEHRRAGEVTTFSRFPLVESRDYKMPMPHQRKLLATTWATPYGSLCVLNAHIATTAAGQPPLRNYGLVSRVTEVVRHARGTAVKRASQLPVIDRALDDCQTPVLLAGDFNNPPRGRFYRHLSGRLRDAFAQAGWGLGQSFPTRFPLLRIDYIWLGEGLRASRCFNPATRASDHLPVVADVSYGSS